MSATVQIGGSSAHTRSSLGILQNLLLNQLDLVHTGITQDLNGASPVTSDALVYLESIFDFVCRRSTKGDSKGHTVFYSLCAALALIWLFVRVRFTAGGDMLLWHAYEGASDVLHRQQ